MVKKNYDVIIIMNTHKESDKMNKKIFKLLLFVMLSFISFGVKAEEYTFRVKVVNDGANLRVGTGSNTEKIDSLDEFDYYEMVNNTLYKDTNNNKNCSKGWYNIIYYTGKTGYVCADDVEVVTSFAKDTATPTNSCEKELQAAGFPASYWGGLCRLKELHKTWNFQAVNTNLEWAYAVEKESGCGKNFVSASIYDKTFLDSSCKLTSPGNYVAPSQKGVAYYMDPRNFFTEKYIFQFLDQSYDATLKSIYPETVLSIIAPTKFYEMHKDKGIVDIIAKITSASPIAMASRIRNELGNGTSLINLWSGTYEGYEGFYNFYNWGVGDNCVRDYGTTICGLSTAKEYNWNSIETAIINGADTIAALYISVGQYTNYFQKFNLVPTTISKRFTHQYMTNLPGPMSESKIAYSTYAKNNLLDISLNFKIPVFSKMDTPIVNSSNGAIQSEANGLGTIDIATIITSSGYSYSNGYLLGVKESTDVADIKEAIEAVGGSNSASIQNKDGEVVTSGIVATGYKIKIANSSASETLTIVVKGDPSGDGKINALDLLQVQKAILGTYTLEGASAYAADPSGDGKINALDLLQVQKQILGTYTIE